LRLLRQPCGLSRNDRRNSGFTLAEVLLVITIIGVVASLTIPGLILNIQTQQYKAAWKKTFSRFSAATIELMNDNNSTMIGVNGANVRTLRDKYANYLNVLKSCGYNQVLGNCWHTVGTVKYMDGNITTYTDTIEAGFVLADGTLINFGYVSDPNCNSHYGGSGTIKCCNRIFFDINGFKGPNMYGKDIFRIYILKDRIVPEGVDNDMNENKPSTSCPDDGVSFGAFTYPGAGCAAKYLMQ